MKVSKWVDFGQEVDVEISTEDIRAALGESFGKVGEDRVMRDLGDDQPYSPHHVTSAFNSIAQFLKALRDEQIAILTDKQREIIAGFLREASERFEPVTSVNSHEKLVEALQKCVARLYELRGSTGVGSGETIEDAEAALKLAGVE